MKDLFKNKIFLASSAGVLALAVILAAVCFHQKQTVALLPIAGSSQDTTVDVHTETGQDTSNISTIPSEETGDTQPSGDTAAAPVLDVGGNPGKAPDGNAVQGQNKADAGNDTDAEQGTVTTSAANLPSVKVDVESDGEQPKKAPTTTTTTANTGWTPPAPGEGTGELISSGLESIPVSSDSSVEQLQPDIGFEVGGKLIDAGYNTLYPDAGTPKDMVEDAVKSYAETGAVKLNSDRYGLPAIVGYYNIKLPVQGANAAEAANYIFNYMKNDAVFNQQVKTVFTKYQDGFLSVYQKGGYFYVLFAVINKGYSNVG